MLCREFRGRTEIEIGPLNETDRDSWKTVYRSLQRARNRARIGDVLSKVPALVDPGYDDGGRVILQQVIHRKRHAVGWRAVHREVMLINFFDSKRARQR